MMIPLRYNLRSLMVRRATSVMTAMGVALVVMILLILLGFVAGLRQTVLEAGNKGNWIVLSRGVTSEPGSYITLEQYQIVRSRPEIRSGPSGKALVSPERVTGFVAQSKDASGHSQFTFIRGVEPIAYRVHHGMRIASGRLPQRGQSEIVVGRKLAARFPNLRPPHKIRFGRRSWTIVGIFSDNHSARESEVWTDLHVLQQDIDSGSGFNSLHLVLRPGMEESFSQALTKDARLRVDAMSEEEFYAAQSKLADQVRMLGLIVAVILAVGAAFGGMNTMYAAVARRTREVGVLRTLGFSRTSVLASFVAESVILALVGGIVGELLGVAVASVTGLNSRLLNVGAYIFSFQLPLSAFVAGLIAAALIGFFGGLLPAWRAARIGVMESLRTA